MTSKPPYELWQKRRGRIRSQVGHWQAGRDARFRDHALLGELLHQLNETQLMVYGICGRIISQALACWIDKAYFMTSYPDSRLWCNSIARLAASADGSPVAAMTASFLAADSKAYGSYAVYNSALAVQDCVIKMRQGLSLTETVASYSRKGTGANIPGFLRPVKVDDERIAPMMQITRELGFSQGEHLSFAFELSAHLQAKNKGGMNAAGFYSAFLLDQSFQPFEIYLLCIRCIECGALPCYQEQLDEPENGFLPLACEDIKYRGPKRRTL